jgi:hypothetical protein
MCFIQSGNTTIIAIPNLDPETQKGMADLIALLFFFSICIVIIASVFAPVWVPFVLLQTLFENFVKQLSNDGWIIEPIIKFILLSVGFILLSTIYCFVITPILTRTFNFSSFVRKIHSLILRIFHQPITTQQKPSKSLIDKKILVWVWLLSLVCLPLIAFHTQVGFTKTNTDVEQNVFDQLKLLELENKYALNLKPEERQFMLDLTRTKYKKIVSKYNGLSIDYNNETTYTNLGKRSSIILFYDELVRLGNKYHFPMNMAEKLTILDLSEKIAKMHRKREDEIISDHDILKFLEYSVISTIAEDRALKQITSFTSDELKLFGKLEPNKLWLPRFARNRSIELTKLWRHDLSNHQKKVFYEDYCNVVVNSIYRAYHVESGYLPGKNDAKLIKSEAKNPKGNPDFNDCRKFLISKGYQLSNGAMFVYFYKP